MLKVDNSNPIQELKKLRKKSNVNGSSFGDYLTDEVEGTEVASIISTINSLSSLQQVIDDIENKQRSYAQGKDILECLEDLKRKMLHRELSQGDLTNLISTLEQARIYSMDLSLNNVIDEIEIRARIEIAKIERNMG
jgi:hypothetical protein